MGNIKKRRHCQSHVQSQDVNSRYSKYQRLAPEEICAGIPDLDGDGLTDGGADACQGYRNISKIRYEWSSNELNLT